MKKVRCLSLLILLNLLSSYIIANEPDCVVRLYSTVCDLKDGKLVETDTIIIQINNRNGEEYCDIEVSYDQDDPITRLSAWISDTAGGIIRQLKKQDYTDESEISGNNLYQDYFVRKFTLKHNVYPYLIAYTYQTVYRQFLKAADWSPVLDTDVPTKKARLVFQCPEKYPVRIREKNINAPSNKSSNGYSVQTWNASYDGSVKREIFSPYLRDFVPLVQIIPLQFYYGVSGNTDSWQSFGNWQNDLLEGLDDLPLTEQQKIKELTGSVEDKQQKVRILYHYLQDNTRYVNVTLGIGGLKPYPATYVSINKYGDCKGLTNYMKAMLQVAGIESYYTTVFAGWKPREIITEIPSQQFNHVILAVPLDKDTLWLENTNNTNPFGYAGTFIQNRQALLIDGKSSRLVRTPSLREKDVQVSGRMEFLLDAEGNANINLHYNFRGEEFENYNAVYTQYNKEIQNSYIHDHLPFQAFEMRDWTLVKKDRDDRNIVLESAITVKHFVKKIGTEQYFSFLPADIPDFTSPKKRRLPVILPYPIYETDTLIYHLPLTRSKIVLPENTFLKSKYGWYHIAFYQQGEIVTVLREFLLYPMNIALSEYNDFYNFMNSIKLDEKRKILIQPL
jgi:hypothetical protein